MSVGFGRSPNAVPRFSNRMTPYLVDHERRRAVRPFRVDAHLEGHAVSGADGVHRVGEDRVENLVRLGPHVPQHVTDAVRFVGVDGEELDVPLLELGYFVAQLCELAVADGSGVAVHEHQHHGLLALEVLASL